MGCSVGGDGSSGNSDGGDRCDDETDDSGWRAPGHLDAIFPPE